MPALPLDTLPQNTLIRLISIDGGRQLIRKMLSLGVSVGGEFEILTHNGPGVVLAHDGNRIAIGRGIAAKIMVERL